MFVLNDARTEMIRASVLDAPTVEMIDSDFNVHAWDSSLFFKNAQVLKDVVEFSFSFAYDPAILEFWSPLSIPGAEISEIRNEDGFIQYILRFKDAQDISANSNIIDIPYSKPQEKSALVNTIQVNFTDTQWEVYLLSSGKTLF